MGCRFTAIALLLLAGCAAPDAILIGEQHDAPQHQALQRQAVDTLIARGQLAALALEMAAQGRSTKNLPHDASEAAARAALAWDDDGWPWAAYGPAVMAAVRAGVPVIGANLPRPQLREAMADARLDGAVPAAVLEAQRQAVRSGHCDLLSDTQLGPMARVQIARDRAMAQAVAQAAMPGKTVVLLAGAQHVDVRLGVPLHLPPGLRARSERLPEQPPRKDYCAQLRHQVKPAPPS
jgi:uncharacterized iron-regulated protein